MSLLHRRAVAMGRTSTTADIPEWAELIKLDEGQALALAQQHGIAEADRMADLQALNAKRKASQ